MHTRIPRSNTNIELGRTHRRHHGTIVANEIARSQPHWRCVREVAGKRNTRGTSVSLLSRNGIVPTSRSARTPRPSTNNISHLTEIIPLFLRPSLLRSFFLLLYLSHSPSPLARPVYAKQRRTHGRKYIRTVYHRDRLPSTV